MRKFIVGDHHTVNGWVRFKGTRMPLQILVENLVGGATPEKFLEDYPSDISLADIALFFPFSAVIERGYLFFTSLDAKRS